MYEEMENDETGQNTTLSDTNMRVKPTCGSSVEPKTVTGNRLRLDFCHVSGVMDTAESSLAHCGVTQ